MWEDVFYRTVFQNRVIDYVTALVIFFAGAGVILLLKGTVFRRLDKWVTKAMRGQAAKSFTGKVLPLFYFAAFYMGIKTLTLHPLVDEGLNYLGMILATFFGVRFFLLLTGFVLENYWVIREKDEAKKNALGGIITAFKVIVWGFAFIVLLDNFGIKVSGLLAGLGIGGVAVALAAQAVLGDLFSYFAIFFDRPFEIGDYIIVGDYMGTVEYIGVKTTRIRSLSGEQLILSNTDLTGSRIRNYKRMKRRRINFQLRVTYQTGLELLREIPGIIKEIIGSKEDALFDRAHFASYGDFSLIFEVVYYILSPDYTKYMDIQQEINLQINEEFTKRGIEFAYPTQTLFINRTEGSEETKITRESPAPTGASPQA